MTLGDWVFGLGRDVDAEDFGNLTGTGTGDLSDRTGQIVGVSAVFCL